MNQFWLFSVKSGSLITVKQPKQNEFERAAAKQVKGGLVGELWGFMKQNKKWWLVPLLMTLLILGLLILAAGAGLAPFIYTLF